MFGAIEAPQRRKCQHQGWALSPLRGSRLRASHTRGFTPGYRLSSLRNFKATLRARHLARWTAVPSVPLSMPEQELLRVDERPVHVFPGLALVHRAGDVVEHRLRLGLVGLARERVQE